MSDQPRRVSRRQALQLSMGGVLAGGGIIAQRRLGGGGGSVETVSPAAPGPLPLIGGAAESVRSIATDGYMSYPGRRVRQPTLAWDGTDGYGYDSDRLDAGDGVYSFGFRTIYDHEVDGPSAFDAPIGELVGKFKGLVHHPSSILGFSKNADVFINMSNLGFEVRPDLDDAHTLHWHGFRQAVTVWDGVPEVSVSVPPTRDFPYYFGALDEGTYMYHCHFEDVEHVQMGMDGILYVNPVAGADHLYEDAPTQFDRQYGLLLNEVDLNPHDLLASVQEFTWSDYDAHYFVINGRSYPDTVRGSGDPGLETSPWYDSNSTLPLQPVSSLIQANQGDRVAIRLANLGYYYHEMQLAGIPITVYGKDAERLWGPGGDLAYVTNTLDCSPGESRDAIFVAPAHSTNVPDDPPDIYLFKNRHVDRLVNGPDPANLAPNGLGGMVTEVHVYPAGTLPAQTEPNEIFPV